MDTEFFYLLFNLIIIFGLFLALKDRSTIKDLKHTVSELKKIIDLQTKKIEEFRLIVDELKDNRSADIAKNHVSEEATDNNMTLSDDAVTKYDYVTKQSDLISQTPFSEPMKNVSPQFKLPNFNLDTIFKGNGIFWLGAFILSIGGIFLAKYSIETGLLPPYIRVIFGGIFGIALVMVAEVLNRNKIQLLINTPYISAALASGGLITCFSMVLLSFNHYNFIPANVTFVFLAIISLTATYLALRFGPLLAGIGIIGAYVVPVLVSTDSNNVVALLLYVSFVSLSAVWVADYVKKDWLWWLSLLGHSVWFLAAIFINDRNNFVLFTSFTVASLYFYTLSNLLGWRLNQTMQAALPIKTLLMARREQVATLLTLFLFAFYLYFNDAMSNLVIASLVVGSIACFAAFRHSAFDTWPFLALAFVIYMFLYG